MPSRNPGLLFGSRARVPTYYIIDPPPDVSHDAFCAYLAKTNRDCVGWFVSSNYIFLSMFCFINDLPSYTEWVKERLQQHQARMEARRMHAERIDQQRHLWFELTTACLAREARQQQRELDDTEVTLCEIIAVLDGLETSPENRINYAPWARCP